MILYEELLSHPNAPKIYRELAQYYRKLGKIKEAEAFAALLDERFGETRELHDNDSNPDAQQR